MIQIMNPSDYRAALYIRLSKEDKKKDKKDDSESISNQRAILTEFAQSRNISVAGIYTDDGYSGVFYDRPDLEKLTEDIVSGKINMVIAKDLSRFGRQRIEQEYFIYSYSEKYNNVRFLAIGDDFDTADTGNPSKELYHMIKNWSNEDFVRQTSMKISMTKRFKQKQGLFIGGKAPYGYKLNKDVKNKLFIDEEAAEIVRRIFTLALSGISCRQIAVKLNNERIPPPAVYANLPVWRKGPYVGKWSSERVTDMLKNEMYIGNMVQGRSIKVSYKTKKCERVPRDKWIIVPDTHEPIIEKAVFYKVQELILSRRHTRDRTYDYPLKGLIYCHECGKPLAVIKRTNAQGEDVLYFMCRTYQRFTQEGVCTSHCIRESLINEAVMGEIRELCGNYMNREDLESTAQQTLSNRKNTPDPEKELPSMQKKLDALNAKLDRMYDDWISGVMDEADYNRRSENAKEDRKFLRDKMKIIMETKPDTTSFEEQAQQYAERFLQEPECNRELLVSLIDRVELTQNREIIIHYKFSQLQSA